MLKGHICAICSKYVYMNADLKPLVPHHWECWKNLDEKQIARFTRLAEMRAKS